MEKSLVEEYTPPNTPEPNIPEQRRDQAGPSRQAIKGKQIQRRNKEELKRQIISLREKLQNSEKRVGKYKKRLQRMRKKLPETPNKVVTNLLQSQEVTPEVRRNLVFTEVIQQQLKSNFAKQQTVSEKRQFVENISGNIINKYKFKRILASTTSRRIVFKNKQIISSKRLENIKRIKKAVQIFFEDDAVSRMCPGKKDTVTFKKTKKQKRYLNSSIKNSYKNFEALHPKIKISYSTFCRFRPFWILQPNARMRETCLCSNHENMA